MLSTFKNKNIRLKSLTIKFRFSDTEQLFRIHQTEIAFDVQLPHSCDNLECQILKNTVISSW